VFGLRSDAIRVKLGQIVILFSFGFHPVFVRENLPVKYCQEMKKYCTCSTNPTSPPPIHLLHQRAPRVHGKILENELADFGSPFLAGIQSEMCLENSSRLSPNGNTRTCATAYTMVAGVT
jgi:hypothetical protein